MYAFLLCISTYLNLCRKLQVAGGYSILDLCSPRAAGCSINVLVGYFWFALSPKEMYCQPPKHTPGVPVLIHL